MRGAVVVLVALCAAMVLPAGAPAHPTSSGGFASSGAMWELLCGAPDPEACAVSGRSANVRTGRTEKSREVGLALLTNVPKPATVAGTNSDLAFWGKYAIAGNYDGLNIFDITDPAAPAVVSSVKCPGSQNDVTVFRNLIFTSTDSQRSDDSCASESVSGTTNPTYWEGIRIWDWTNPANPVDIKTVATDCGSHTHTLVPDLQNDRVLLYVSSYSPGALLNCLPPHDKISIVEVPLNSPTSARVLSEPVLFPTGGQASTSGCHDITVYQAVGLAAGACMGEGIIMDISSPASPRVLSTMTDPNFSFWHSATFSNDGKTVIFTDEQGGGTQARCKSGDNPAQGSDAFYDISNPSAPVYLSRFKIARAQTAQENCVSHNGSLIPDATRDLFVQAWYQGGTSIIDFTDRSNPKEIAFFDRGPVDPTKLVSGGHWSSYWYNGKIYGNEIARGFDVLSATNVGDKKVRQPYLNVQTQEPLRR